MSVSAFRTRKDVCDHEQDRRGHHVHSDLWPWQPLASAVPDHEESLLQPGVLLRVPAAEDGPEDVSVRPGGELQTSLLILMKT